MALVFPTSPTIGDRWPLDPGLSGVSQYQWTGAVWNTVPTSVSIGATNQGAFNAYEWPNADGTAGYQLQTDGAGNLTWEVAGTGNLVVLALDVPPNGSQVSFGLIDVATSALFSPNPSTNIVVFLGGVPQTPGSAYLITAATITFTDAPPAGTTFYAISSVVV